MTAITKFVKLTTSPDSLQTLRDVLEELAGETRKETGCILYDIHDDNADSCRVVEVWKDEAALQAHMHTAHIAKVAEIFGTLLVGAPEVEDYFPTCVAACDD